jgi:hypothetical protein
MKHDVEAALDQCLVWLRSGTGIEDCLARYPEYADELRPLLLLVADVGRVLTPASSAAARAAGQERMLAALAQRRERQIRANPLARYIQRARWAFPARLGPAWGLGIMMLVVILFACGGIAATVSADSLPGDVLYPLKLAGWQVRLTITLDPAKYELLEARHRTQQLLDVGAALDGGRQATVEFQGELQQQEGNLWTVGGLPVTVQDSTRIVGQPVLGALVRVRGDLPGNGELFATWLGVDEPATSWPTQTPEPADTVPPTETPQPTETPALTTTVEPTTEVSAPTVTPVPAEAIETGTPGLTDGAQPEDMPEEAETSEPTEAINLPETPESSDTPEPAPAPEETEMPELDESPEQQETPDSAETAEPDKESDDDAADEPARPPGNTPEDGGAAGPTEPAEEDDKPGRRGTAEPTEPRDQDDDRPGHGGTTEPAEPPDSDDAPEDNGPVESPAPSDDSPGHNTTPEETREPDD